MKEKGHIFLWIEVDELSLGLPHAYALAYDPELVKEVEVAMGKIQDGEDVAGTITDEVTAAAKGIRANPWPNRSRKARVPWPPNSGSVGERFFDFDASMLTFGRAARRHPR